MSVCPDAHRVVAEDDSHRGVLLGQQEHERRSDRLAACGAAWLMAQPAFTPDALARHLTAVLGNAPVLTRAAAAAAKEARPDAARRLADLVQSLMRADALPESR